MLIGICVDGQSCLGLSILEVEIDILLNYEAKLEIDILLNCEAK